MATATDSDVYDPKTDPSDEAIVEELAAFDRPNVLGHQHDPAIVDAVLDEFETTTLFELQITTDEPLVERAYSIESPEPAGEAAMVLELPDRERSRVAALPPADELEMDVRWWLSRGRVDDVDVEITQLRQSVIEHNVSILRPHWESAVRALFADGLTADATVIDDE